MTASYELQDRAFALRNYDTLSPFTSFLPGLAGTKGIPVWAFYVNRGQGICSFGIENKSNAIIEFDPAYLAYEKVSTNGFRTFLRINGQYFEPFAPDNDSESTEMAIEENMLHIHSRNEALGLDMTVTYYVMPNEDYGALVRRVTISNMSKQSIQLEGLDGLPRLIPYGIKNGEYKEMANLLRSWSEVRNMEQGAPFFTLRSTTSDSAQVGEVGGGYFAYSQVNGVITTPICDSWAVFGESQSLQRPRVFSSKGLHAVKAHQENYANKLPCVFTPFSAELAPSASVQIETAIGYAKSEDWLKDKLPMLQKPSYWENKQQEAQDLVDTLLQDVHTSSAQPLFDRYIRQCYLDNVLRGGYPVEVPTSEGQSVIHLFSRKHGDPERDYNFFSLAAQPYSQGNGNFRDVLQNRRNDALLHPFSGAHNIQTFMNFIQADGYNPLEVQGVVLSIPSEKQAALSKLLSQQELEPGSNELASKDITSKGITSKGIVSKDLASKDLASQLMLLAEKPFTLGQLAMVTGVDSPLLSQILALTVAESNAAYHEGYWVDHWVYLLDLVENTLKLYPDQRKTLLFEQLNYRFYNSPARVVPRSQKYVLENGQPRQYYSVVLDEVKQKQGWKPSDTRWLTTSEQEVYQVGLYAKLFMLATIKFATLDPNGMGIEMESNKPGWNDAMNGLPGLFGSSIGEALELKRLLIFLKQQASLEPETVALPLEFATFLTTLQKLIALRSADQLDAFTYWDACSTAREQYRETVRFSVNGQQQTYRLQQLIELCKQMIHLVDLGLERAKGYGDGLIPTFFIYTPVQFEELLDGDGQPALAPCGLPRFVVQAFEPSPLPTFLEGPVKQLSITQNLEQATKLHQTVRSSELFDRKLQMYKTSVPLDDQPMSIGRIRAFTAGWQERESIFLHMHYKYVLAMLRAGLYDSYFTEMKSSWLPFRDAKVYGRSPLENSSFIASSVNPDPSLHGRGFVTRLSGSTIEVLSMWLHMMVGDQWFTYSEEHQALSFTFKPVLPGWLFDDEGKLSFRLLSTCQITYNNKRRGDTFGEHAALPVSISFSYAGEQVSLPGNQLTNEWAYRLRDGKLENIVVELA